MITANRKNMLIACEEERKANKAISILHVVSEIQ